MALDHHSSLFNTFLSSLISCSTLLNIVITMEYFHMISANQSYPPYDINILQFNQSLLGSTWGGLPRFHFNKHADILLGQAE
jgi:hypothetical protein